MYSRNTIPAVALACCGLTAVASAETFDVIIRHGTIVDGSGRARYAADIAVRDGYVVKIGDLSAGSASQEIDAAGQFVTPGFINIHSHAGADALSTAANMLAQGVTTEILYPDGNGPTDIVTALRKLGSKPIAENIGGYIGFNGIWESVMGPSDHRPSSVEIDRMRGLVAEGLQQGAWGVSAGLDYKPAYFASTDEVIRIVSAGASWRTNFPNHERVTPPQFSSRTGIGETIRIGTESGMAPEITHIKAQGHEQGKGPEIVEMMTRASRAGHYTPADVYPYLAGITGLQDLLIPGWAQDGGVAAMLNRFKDPKLRARIARESEAAMNARLTGGAEGVQLLQLNKSLTDVMAAEHVGAGEAVIRTLEGAGEQELYAVLQFGSEADLEAFLRYDGTAVACDCGATLLKLTHPRFYGTYPRILGRYVREKQVLTWERAIEKMTALPASTIGMVDRGVLSVGMRADITVFDPTVITDRATYAQPSLMPDGVREVLVNGRSAWHEGSPSGVAAGSVVFRSRHMPTRPWDSRSTRHARVAAAPLSPGGGNPDKDHLRLTLDIVQTGSSSHAKGTIRIEGAGEKDGLEMLDFGELQLSERWLTVSGIARWEGRIEPVTLILDAADPNTDRKIATLIVDSPARHAEWQTAATPIEFGITQTIGLQ